METIRGIINSIGNLFKSKEGLLVVLGLFALFALLIKFLKPRWLIRKIGAVRTVRRRGRTVYRTRRIFRGRRRRR